MLPSGSRTGTEGRVRRRCAVRRQNPDPTARQQMNPSMSRRFGVAAAGPQRHATHARQDVPAAVSRPHRPRSRIAGVGLCRPDVRPLSCYVHTYCCTFRIHAEQIASEVWLEKHDDMMQSDGCFYGDMEYSSPRQTTRHSRYDRGFLANPFHWCALAADSSPPAKAGSTTASMSRTGLPHVRGRRVPGSLPARATD